MPKNPKRKLPRNPYRFEYGMLGIPPLCSTREWTTGILIEQSRQKSLPGLKEW
jgi:hypothetical protein